MWNQYLINQIPTVFESLINCVIKVSEYLKSGPFSSTSFTPKQMPTFNDIPLSQCEILGRILECLPIKNRTNASGMGVFACLGEKIREKLSNIPWLPVLNGAKFSLPSRVLLSSPNSPRVSIRVRLIYLLEISIKELIVHSMLD